MNKKRFALRLLIVIVLLAVILGGIAYQKKLQIEGMQAKMSQPQPPATVSATEVRAEQWQPAISAVGSVVAIDGVDVTTEVAGIVSDIAFESGQRVQEGDVLVELKDTVDQAVLEGLVADSKLAEVEYRRTADLIDKRAISQSQFDEAKARFDAAQAKVAEQRARIRQKTIRAPFAGVLGLKRVDPGQFLSPGSQVVTLQALSPIYVEYSLPERQFNDVQVGQTVRVRVDAYPERTYEGEISAIDTAVNPGSRSFLVRATLANDDNELRPGMFAQVETVQARSQRVLTVPRTAISFNTYGDFVYLVQSGEGETLTVERKQVTTGQSRDGYVAVTKGLEAGDRVVSAGLVKLRNGQSIQIDNSTELEHAEVSSQ